MACHECPQELLHRIIPAKAASAMEGHRRWDCGMCSSLCLLPQTLTWTSAILQKQRVGNACPLALVAILLGYC